MLSLLSLHVLHILYTFFCIKLCFHQVYVCQTSPSTWVTRNCISCGRSQRFLDSMLSLAFDLGRIGRSGPCGRRGRFTWQERHFVSLNSSIHLNHTYLYPIYLYHFSLPNLALSNLPGWNRSRSIFSVSNFYKHISTKFYLQSFSLPNCQTCVLHLFLRQPHLYQ